MSMYAYIKGISDANKIEKAKQTRANLISFGMDYDSQLDDIIESEISVPHKKYTDESEDIIEVNVKDIPDNVEKIQFIISY